MNRYKLISIYRERSDIIKKTLIIRSESPQSAVESVIDRSFRNNVKYYSPVFREYINGCIIATEESSQ